MAWFTLPCWCACMVCAWFPGSLCTLCDCIHLTPVHTTASPGPFEAASSSIPFRPLPLPPSPPPLCGHVPIPFACVVGLEIAPASKQWTYSPSTSFGRPHATHLGRRLSRAWIGWSVRGLTACSRVTATILALCTAKHETPPTHPHTQASFPHQSMRLTLSTEDRAQACAGRRVVLLSKQVIPPPLLTPASSRDALSPRQRTPALGNPSPS